MVQNNSEEKAIDVQPSNPGAKPREKDRAMKSEDHRKEIIEWPKANIPEWQRLYHDISELLKTLNSITRKKAISPQKMYAMSKERL